MPVDSIWNTPEVRPSESIWKVSGSSSGNGVQVKVGGWLDHLHRVVQHRQVPQAQEVHL